jgi:ribosomal protein S8
LNKNLTFFIFFTKKNLSFIKILKSFNFIHKYSLIKKNNQFFLKLFVFFFRKKNISSNFKIISKPSKFFFISYKALRLLNKRTGSSIFIISTNRGFLSHHQAIKNKLGGYVVGFFSL